MKIKQGISSAELVMTVGFLAFFIPASYALPSPIFQLWEFFYMGTALASVAYLFLKHLKDLNIRYISMILYFTWIVLGTQLVVSTRSFSIFMIVKKYLKYIGYVSLLELGFHSCSKKTMVRSYLNAGLLISMIHFISFVVYSRQDGGMRHGDVYRVGTILVRNPEQNWYFLTYDNDSIYYFLPILVLLLYDAWYQNRKSKKTFYLYLGILLFMYLTKTAATAIIGTFIFTGIILYYAAKMKRQRRKNQWQVSSILNYTNATIIGLGVQVAVLLFVGSDIANKFAGYFGKDATFSGRLEIWDAAFKYIRANLLTGVGMEDSASTTAKIYQTHCHNMIVENLYTGGIIGLALFLLIVFAFKPKAKKSFAVLICSAALLTYYVIGALDWLYTNPIPMALFYFSYYLSDSEESLWVFLTRRLGLFNQIDVG